ncbi:ATP-binding cassette domain-containing protein [Paracoccus limosus]|uniref:ATP-binding cassette domain-containing protein n=1 Tax=Paracoccus limosus TaxID=913252 RepID=A0A844H6W0_9RHOB|nr:ABC transporter ATP-binding protein/permease [Paracoccus limosus]MTH35313.1 ATP-binding cassette domain-containing protein [Paracoccus limosus]
MTEAEAAAGAAPRDMDAPTLRAQLAAMGEAFWTSRQRNGLFALALCIVAVIGATAWFQIRLNAWNQPFYDALTRRDLPAFVQQLWVFAQLALVLLALNVTQAWLREMSKLLLRKGLVHDLLSEWMLPQRAFRLSNAGSIGENPDQRIAADAQQLTELTTNLGMGLLQASLLLASFIGVLWELSSGMFVRIGDMVIAPPGFMVWCALLYAAIASLASWLVGRPLIRLDSERYAREAQLRFALVRVNEDLEGIALFGGEAAERTRLRRSFSSVLTVMRQLVGANTRLTWVTAGYGWFTLVAPILVAAPSYFAGRMSFGELMMIVGAFNQVQSSLRWFVDNFSSIADWQATLLRVAAFREALRDMDRRVRHAAHLELSESRDDTIRLSDVAIASSAGTVRLMPAQVQLAPGERVLVLARHGAGKTLFFRAISGLWPWGSGRIERPNGGRVMFLPQRAYVPPGSLRASVSYPSPASAFKDAEIRAAMQAVGLDRLVPALDRQERWDRQLAENEKQLLCFARLLLHRPRWAVIDDVPDRLDPESRRRVLQLLDGPLAGMGVVLIGSTLPEGGNFGCRLELVMQAAAADPAGDESPADPGPPAPRAPT